MKTLKYDFNDCLNSIDGVFTCINGDVVDVKINGLIYSKIIENTDNLEILYQGLSYLENKYGCEVVKNSSPDYFIDFIKETTDLNVELLDEQDYDSLLTMVVDISMPNIRIEKTNKSSFESGENKDSMILRNVINQKIEYYENMGVNKMIYDIIKNAEYLRTKGFDIYNLTPRKIYNFVMIHNSIDNDKNISKINDLVAVNSLFKVDKGQNIFNDRIKELNK